MANKVKNEVRESTPDPVEMVDRIPSKNIDLEGLAKFCYTQLYNIRTDKQAFESRREKYLRVIEDLVGFTGNSVLPFDGASDFHIPMVMEKSRAAHARLFLTFFGGVHNMYAEPQEPMDSQRISRIESIMRWALDRFVNTYEGIEPVMDEIFWDLVTEGWALARLRWDRQMRKAIVVEEELVQKRGRPKQATMNEDGSIDMQPSIKFTEVEKWIPKFEGPIIENIPKENIYLPGSYTVQNSPFVGLRMTMTAHELRVGAETGFFDKKQVEEALEFEQSKYRGDTIYTSEVADLKGTLQGVRTEDRETRSIDSEDRNLEHDIFECYATFDIDGDGFDEEIIAHYHKDSNKIIRWTYLDRITSTGRRPLYKIDYIKRPGRPYGIGLAELLYNINMELNVMHNQKVDAGTFSIMPFFFYESGSTLVNDRIQVGPGWGIPVNDARAVSFPNIQPNLSFGFQEEAFLMDIASRVSGITDMNLGIAPTPGEAVRSQGQMAALMSEGNASQQVVIKRGNKFFSELYTDIHQMLVDKLPKEFQYLVVGKDGEASLNSQTGLPDFISLKNSRQEISGKVHFSVRTNSMAGNKELQFGRRMQLAEFYLNPMFIQTGIVDIENLYNIAEAVGESSQELNYKNFLTKPENITKPLSLQDELDHIRQGIMPEIPMNDQHEAKISAIQAWLTSRPVQTGLQLGNVNPNAPTIAAMAIANHMQKLQMMNAQRQALQLQQMQAGGQGQQNNPDVFNSIAQQGGTNEQAQPGARQGQAPQGNQGEGTPTPEQ